MFNESPEVCGPKENTYDYSAINITSGNLNNLL